MKFKILLFVAMVIGMASCNSVDAPMDVTVGSEVATTVSVTIPEVSRAVSGEGFDLTTLGPESQYEMRFILEIYYQDDFASRQVKYVSESSTAFDVRLAPERDYRFVVWADIVAKEDNRVMSADYDHYYETSSSLKSVAIVDSLWSCDAMDRDAYTGKTCVSNFSSASTINVSLTRPFAMLKVVTTDDASQVDKVDKLDVVYDSVYTAFDAYSGKVREGSKKMVKHNNFGVVAHDFYQDATGEHTLFTDFILAPESDTPLVFTFSTLDGNDILIKKNTFSSGVTIKRNTLTTVKGGF
jgi:hypothetical protein